MLKMKSETMLEKEMNSCFIKNLVESKCECGKYIFVRTCCNKNCRSNDSLLNT